MSKRIKSKAPLQGLKVRAHDAPHQSWDKRPIVFSFCNLAHSHCVEQCTDGEKVHVLDALWKRGRMTWAEIKQAPRHGLGCEKIAQNSLQVPLPVCVTPDTTILSFRCIGLAPMIGYRDEDRFHILWIDREFNCYNHN